MSSSKLLQFLLIPLIPLFSVAALPAPNSMADNVHPRPVPLSSAEFPNLKTISAFTGNPTLKSGTGTEFQLLPFEVRGDAKNEPTYRFLIEGGLHGNEEGASLFVLWLARRYAQGHSLLNSLPRGEVAIDFLPYANPDGWAAHTRVNEHGVNLNRNFAVLWGLTKENPGKSSFSEPETQAIRALFNKRHYSAAVDVHGYVNWIVTPSSAAAVEAQGLHPSKARQADYTRWVAAVRGEMPMLTGYQWKTGAILGDGGAFEDWAFWRHGTYAYCLEIETFQRFVHSYRRDFNDPSHLVTGVRVDLYKRYETFIYRNFLNAIALKKAERTPAKLAVH